MLAPHSQRCADDAACIYHPPPVEHFSTACSTSANVNPRPHQGLTTLEHHCTKVPTIITAAKHTSPVRDASHKSVSVPPPVGVRRDLAARGLPGFRCGGEQLVDGRKQ